MRRAAIVLCFTAACTPMHYAQPGATAAQLETDLQECRDWAREESYLYPLMRPDPLAAGNPHREMFYDPHRFQLQYERDFERYCMRSRGYRLEAAE